MVVSAAAAAAAVELSRPTDHTSRMVSYTLPLAVCKVRTLYKTFA